MRNKISPWLAEAPEAVSQWEEGVLICCDAIDFLKSVRSEIADVIFLDPPFNLGKRYGSSGKEADLLAEADYTDFMHEVLTHSIRVVKPGGALFLYHIPYWALKLGGSIQQEMLFRHWIAVSMKNSFARGDFLYPAHYALLYFTKGSPNVFNRPKIPAPTCRHCGKHLKDYGGYKQFVEDGINLSDVWDDLSPVRHSHKKNRPANELPLELLRRVVQISGKKGGLLIDPFVGSGTSVIAAAEVDMRFLACDREPSCCDVVVHRFAEYQTRKHQSSIQCVESRNVVP
jgi:site-specific DNA-methyltransferase (adenine-specific)